MDDHECPDCGVTWTRVTRTRVMRCAECRRVASRSASRRHYSRNPEARRASSRAHWVRTRTDEVLSRKRMYMAQRRLDEPERLALLKIASKYGITVAEYRDLLTAQSHGCAMCGTKQQDLPRRLHVDHDHSCCPGVKSCGRCVRGLLCSQCNSVLGLAKDRPETLRAGIAYLAQSRGQLFAI